MNLIRKIQVIIVATCIGAFWLLPKDAAAGYFEFSGGFSFNRSNYSADSFTWSRHWGSSFGYHFTEHSGIEFSFSDTVDRNKIDGIEDTTYHDQVYSVDWIQELTGKGYALQPYFKVGIGQLNRSAGGTYLGTAPTPVFDQVIGVLGAGLRLYVTRNVALRAEGTSYLSGGAIGSWKDNFNTSFGFSIYL
jgi:hypothetical protein